jgi:hypothetical protein
MITADPVTLLANWIATVLDDDGYTEDLDLCARALHVLLTRIDQARETHPPICKPLDPEPAA